MFVTLITNIVAIHHNIQLNRLFPSFPLVFCERASKRTEAGRDGSERGFSFCFRLRSSASSCAYVWCMRYIVICNIHTYTHTHTCRNRRGYIQVVPEHGLDALAPAFVLICVRAFLAVSFQHLPFEETLNYSRTHSTTHCLCSHPCHSMCRVVKFLSEKG